MASYVVRVELHGAGGNSAAYDALHQHMKNAGFRRWVRFTDGIWKLPTGEYLKDANSGLHATARDQAVAAAKLTGYNCEVFVAEVYNSNWCSTGLAGWR